MQIFEYMERNPITTVILASLLSGCVVGCVQFITEALAHIFERDDTEE